VAGILPTTSVLEGKMREHQNLALVRRVGTAIQTRNIRDAAAALAENVAWDYFNPRLPELAGDHVGLRGISAFFDKLARDTACTFTVESVSASEIRDELVVTQARIKLTLQGRAIVTDAVACGAYAAGGLRKSGTFLPYTRDEMRCESVRWQTRNESNVGDGQLEQNALMMLTGNETRLQR
jgi:uncharacterized protein